MGFLEVLFLILLTLKLLGEITISWFWVFSPLIPAAVIWVVCFSFIVSVFARIFNRANQKW
jgi:hypothetical protein